MWLMDGPFEWENIQQTKFSSSTASVLAGPRRLLVDLVDFWVQIGVPVESWTTIEMYKKSAKSKHDATFRNENILYIYTDGLWN